MWVLCISFQTTFTFKWQTWANCGLCVWDQILSVHGSLKSGTIFIFYFFIYFNWMWCFGSVLQIQGQVSLSCSFIFKDQVTALKLLLKESSELWTAEAFRLHLVILLPGSKLWDRRGKLNSYVFILRLFQHLLGFWRGISYFKSIQFHWPAWQIIKDWSKQEFKILFSK